MFVLRVSEELEIKISDFGLAKEVGHDDSYVMAKKTKLPIKWMSIESLNGVFSEKSDVVSMIVTLSWYSIDQQVEFLFENNFLEVAHNAVTLVLL